MGRIGSIAPSREALGPSQTARICRRSAPVAPVRALIRTSTRWRSWFADCAYGTGDLRAAIDSAGHRAVINPKPLQVAVPGGFTIDDFTVDEPAGTVTCPNQLARQISPGRVATFGVACRSCPLAHRCTTSKTRRKIVLHEHDAEIRAARREWAGHPDLRAESAHTDPTSNARSPRSPPVADAD
ncbi:MAG TPA: hypothetical protein VI248_07395 [Kineosporiaceae bacterium]